MRWKCLGVFPWGHHTKIVSHAGRRTYHNMLESPRWYWFGRQKAVMENRWGVKLCVRAVVSEEGKRGPLDAVETLVEWRYHPHGLNTKKNKSSRENLVTALCAMDGIVRTVELPRPSAQKIINHWHQALNFLYYWILIWRDLIGTVSWFFPLGVKKSIYFLYYRSPQFEFLETRLLKLWKV